MERIRTMFVVIVLAAGFLLITHVIAPANQERSLAEAAPLSSSQERMRVFPTELGVLDDADGTLELRATLRISIPFGFDTPLPVLSQGRDVVVSGHGGCTADEQVTVAITVTQSASGAAATGQTVETCTGDLQSWSTTITAESPEAFLAGAAEACGFATTRGAGYVTDTFDWCRNVDLALLEPSVYLPVILTP